MASNTICTSCLRAIRLQARNSRHSNPIASTSSSRFNQRALTSSTQRHFSITRSQSADTPPPPPPPRPNNDETTAEPSSSAITNFAAKVRKRETFKAATEPYIAYGSTEDLFRECNNQCNYTIPSRLEEPQPEELPKNAAGEDIGVGEGWWYQSKSAGGLALDVTFNTWAQVIFLHMWMLTVRLRSFPAEHAKVWHQNLLDHFFYAAEDRMVMWHGMTSNSARQKYLKDLFQQWRGTLLSYDEGIVKGDATMAAAVWRNVFKADLGTDVEDLAMVTAFLRRELVMLDALSDHSIGSGEVKFGDPREVRKLVERENPDVKETIRDQQKDSKVEDVQELPEDQAVEHTTRS